MLPFKNTFYFFLLQALYLFCLYISSWVSYNKQKFSKNSYILTKFYNLCKSCSKLVNLLLHWDILSYVP